MNHFARVLSIVCLLGLFLPCAASGSPACPVQGLDDKVCPVVVNFFDDIAKNSPDFAKHWQNHHWVGQTGSTFSFKDLKLQIGAHQTLMFGKRWKSMDLEKFINDNLARAAKSNPKFQQVIDSHNFFVMTVQAMHLALQGGADHFNVGGAPRISASGQPENVELELFATETYQVPTTSPMLNNAGIYTTDKYHNQHSVKIDSTTYKARVTVAPVVVAVANQVSSSPKGHKIPGPGQKKPVFGAGGGTAQTTPAKQPGGNAPITIQKQPGNRGRQGTPAPVAPPAPLTPKTTRGSGGGPQKQVYIVQVPSTSKPANVPSKQNINAPVTIKKQPGGNRGRQGTPPPAVTPQTPLISKGTKGLGNTPPKKVHIGQVSPTITSTPPPQSPGSTNRQAIRPSQVSLQNAPQGTNISNINTVLTTPTAGSQTDANERTYLIDDNNQVWSCKVSSLGFRVAALSDGTLTRHGHVESAHVKSPQLAHIPANHAPGAGCLIAVHK